MDRLELELKEYVDREARIRHLRRNLETAEREHNEKTLAVFGIAPGEPATVHDMVSAIQRVVELMNEKI